MENEWIAAAVKANWEGDLPKALRLLSEYVERCPMDERGWLWLGRVAEVPAQRIGSLRRALSINPYNDVARVELEAAIRTQSPAHPEGKRALPSARALIRLAASLGGWIAFAGAACVFLYLAAAIFPIFLGDRSLVTTSGSMEPRIPTGSVVVVQPVPSASLRVGDVVAFSPSSDEPAPIVHRIVMISKRGNQRYLTTRGDANNSADIEEITLPATAWRAWYSLPLAGYLIAFATSSIGVVAFIVLPLLGLLALSTGDWLKKNRWGRLRKYVPEFPL